MLIDIPAGHLASVVTYLEMTARPEGLPPVPAGPCEIARVAEPDLDWYRLLFRRVGEEWLWFSRLRMNDEDLRAALGDVFVVRQGHAEVGLIELDRSRMPDEVELAFFGVVPEAVGKGAGRQMMEFALAEAWRHGPQKVTVHTCTLDHPRALEFYQRNGFKAVARKVEVEPDPRATGEMARERACWVPVL